MNSNNPQDSTNLLSPEKDAGGCGCGDCGCGANEAESS